MVFLKEKEFPGKIPSFFARIAGVQGWNSKVLRCDGSGTTEDGAVRSGAGWVDIKERKEE